MARMRSYQDYLIDKLASDPNEILCYLEAALNEYHEDGNVDALAIALRNIDKVTGRTFRRILPLAGEKYANHLTKNSR